MTHKLVNNTAGNPPVAMSSGSMRACCVSLAAEHHNQPRLDDVSLPGLTCLDSRINHGLYNTSCRIKRGIIAAKYVGLILG